MRIWMLLPFILMSCHSGPTASKKTDDAKTSPLRIGMRRAPDSLNPYLSATAEGENIAALLYPTLFRELPELENGTPKLQPYLVKTFQWEAGERRLVLNIQPNLKWSDGEPLTSEDVLYSFSLQKDENLGWLDGASKGGIMSWESTGPTQIIVTFSGPSPFNLVNVNEGFIVPKHAFSKVPMASWEEADWSKPDPVFGPYRVRDGLAGEQLLLEPLENGRALSIAFVKDAESLYQMLLADQLDYAWGLNMERFGDIRARLKAVVWDDLSFGFLVWNPIAPKAIKTKAPKSLEAWAALLKEAPHPLFGDSRVRKALTLALNLEDYNKRFHGGLAKVPPSPWRVGLAYLQNSPMPVVRNTAKAAQLLDEAGWLLVNGRREKAGLPFKFSIICNAGSSLRENYLLAIQQDLRELGIEVNLEMMEPGLYTQRCRDRNFDVMFGSFRAGTRPDLQAMFGGDEILNGGFNFSTWIGVDQDLASAAKALTSGELQNALLKLENKFLEEQPMTLLYEGVIIGATQKEGVVPVSNYINPLWSVENW